MCIRDRHELGAAMHPAVAKCCGHLQQALEGGAHLRDVCWRKDIGQQDEALLEEALDVLVAERPGMKHRRSALAGCLSMERRPDFSCRRGSVFASAACAFKHTEYGKVALLRFVRIR